MAKNYSLLDAAGAPIIDLDADWDSKWYQMGANTIYALQLFWSDATVEGSIFLDYSCEPFDNEGENITAATVKSIQVLDGTFNETMFLDASLGITALRLRFEHTLGAANLEAYLNFK